MTKCALDPVHYPHIWDAVIFASEAADLWALSQTCHALRERFQQFLWHASLASGAPCPIHQAKMIEDLRREGCCAIDSCLISYYLHITGLGVFDGTLRVLRHVRILDLQTRLTLAVSDRAGRLSPQFAGVEVVRHWRGTRVDWWGDAGGQFVAIPRSVVFVVPESEKRRPYPVDPLWPGRGLVRLCHPSTERLVINQLAPWPTAAQFFVPSGLQQLVWVFWFSHKPRTDDWMFGPDGSLRVHCALDGFCAAVRAAWRRGLPVTVVDCAAIPPLYLSLAEGATEEEKAVTLISIVQEHALYGWHQLGPGPVCPVHFLSLEEYCLHVGYKNAGIEIMPGILKLPSASHKAEDHLLD